MTNDNKTNDDTQEYTCPVCDTQRPDFAWTDTHGVAQCFECGTPTLLIHYDGDHRVEKPPECLVLPKYIPICREYRRLHPGVRMPSGRSFPGGQELASPTESDQYCEWMDKNADAMLEARGGNGHD